MNKKLPLAILLFLFFSWIPLSFAESGQVEFVPSADTYVDVFSPLSNFGGAGTLNIAYSGNKVQLVWLKFSLSEHVPEGATIDNAILKVFPTIVTETFQVGAFYCSNNSWGEYTINYVNQPEYSNTPLDTLLIPRSHEWYSWNVTQPVKNAFDGLSGASKELSIVLKQIEGQTGYPSLQIGSREVSIRVSLFVHWNDIVPEFPSLLILSALLIIMPLIAIAYKKRMTYSNRTYSKT